MTEPSLSIDPCAYCGKTEGHSSRCSVPKFGAPELRAKPPAYVLREDGTVRPMIDDAMIERGAVAVYEMTRGASLPGVLNGLEVSHVGGRQLAEAVLRAAFQEE